MSRKRWIQVGAVGATMAILLTLVIGVRAFVGGNIGKARRIAEQLQADAIAHPNPIATGTPTVGSLIATPAPAALSAGGTAAPRAGAPSATAAIKSAGTTVPLSPSPTKTSGSVGAQVAIPAPAITKRPVTEVATTPAIAPWRQPTAAEVAEAISAVHSLVPFFTPTAAQIASSGIAVCTAFDQGQSFSTVEADALSMIGASSYSWAIPKSAQATAIQTLVALYCPANAAKLP